MVTLGRIERATRGGSRGRSSSVVVDGADLVASSFTRKADSLQAAAAGVVVEHARAAAQRMKQITGSQRMREAVTSDDEATPTDRGVYADAGPDPRVSNQAFVARFLEQGTVHHAAQPFVQPAGDETMPGFIRAIRDLT